MIFPRSLVSFACNVCFALCVSAQTVTTVSNVHASQTAGTKQVAITYDLTQPTGQSSIVTVEVSTDGGATYTNATGTTGAVGAGIYSGTGKRITWNAGAQWPEMISPNSKVKVTATPVPSGMVLIPAGAFVMGDALDGMSDAPTRTVTLSAYYIGTCDVTFSEWTTVRDWAVTHGYPDLAGVGSGKDVLHPVQMISWYDAVKWLNAKSEMEGLTPAYYTNDAQTSVYRTSYTEPTNKQVKWTGTGYRLPTEAEWEKAARGGLNGKRFPWGDTITHAQANYNSSASYSYDISATRGYNPAYKDGTPPYTSPQASFAANGYGLFNMAGNVYQMCWDNYGAYAGTVDPRGPDTGPGRVSRGGSWGSYASYCRVAYRDRSAGAYVSYGFGFRFVRGSVP